MSVNRSSDSLASSDRDGAASAHEGGEADRESATVGRSSATDRSVWWEIVATIGRVFGPVHRAGGGTVSEDLSKRLVAARIPVPAEVYASSAIGIGLLAGVLAGLGGLVAGIGLTGLLGSAGPFLLMAPALVFSVLGLVGGHWLMLNQVPALLANRRARQINLGLQDMVAYLYTGASSGLNILELIENAAERESEYGEVAEEFKRIQIRKAYSGNSFREAIAHVRETTPSDDLAEFLTNIISVVNEGGDLETHLELEKDEYQDQARRTQEQINSLLEMVDEVMLFVKVTGAILLLVFSLLIYTGGMSPLLLAGVVYGFLPLTTLLYLVLYETLTSDSVGSGMMAVDTDVTQTYSKLTDLSTLEKFKAKYPDQFSVDLSLEKNYKRREALRNPHQYFIEQPTGVLKVTLPITFVSLLAVMAVGGARPTPAGFLAAPFMQTLYWVYLPAFTSLLPFALYYNANSRPRRQIRQRLYRELWNLSEKARYSSTLQDAFASVAEERSEESSNALLATEFGTIAKNKQFGVTIKESLVNLANRYKDAQLTRSLTLIREAQEADQNISQAIDTAAELAKVKESLRADRKESSQTQVVIMGISFLVLVLIVAVNAFNIQPIIESVQTGSQTLVGGLSIDANPRIMMLFYFHAIVVDGFTTGAVIGYVNRQDDSAVLLYALGALLLVALVWFGITSVF